MTFILHPVPLYSGTYSQVQPSSYALSLYTLYCRPSFLKISVCFCLHAFLCHCLINRWTDWPLHISCLPAPHSFWRERLSAHCFISTHGLASHSVHSHRQTPSQGVQTKPSHFPMQTRSSTVFMSAGAKSSAQAWRQNMDNFLTLLYSLLVFTTAKW